MNTLHSIDTITRHPELVQEQIRSQRQRLPASYPNPFAALQLSRRTGSWAPTHQGRASQLLLGSLIVLAQFGPRSVS
jgi:hypothetical protein